MIIHAFQIFHPPTFISFPARRACSMLVEPTEPNPSARWTMFRARERARSRERQSPAMPRAFKRAPHASPPPCALDETQAARKPVLR